MEHKKIIAFYSPYAGAGKSTAAEYLARRYHLFNRGSVRVLYTAFALPVKVIAGQICMQCGISHDYFCKNKDEKMLAPLEDMSFRDLMIWIGESAKDRFGSDFWVKIMRNKIEKSTYNMIIIDDLRFPAEFDMLEDLDAKFVRIEVPGMEIVKSGTEGLLEGYPFHANIRNEKEDLEDYRERVLGVFGMLFRELGK
jgi:hypothetical protein